MKFYTQYDLPKRKSLVKVWDRSDNVDRLSFIPQNQLIRKFMESGRLLQSYRAEHGLYSSEEVENIQERVRPVPVYSPDPVECSSYLDDVSNAQKVLESEKQKVLDKGGKTAD